MINIQKELVMKLLFVIAFLSAQCVLANTETKEFDGSKIKTIEVQNMSGSIRVTGESRANVSVTTEKVKFGEKCTLEVKQDNSKIFVKVDRKTGLWTSDSCEVNVSVSTPQAVSLDLKNGSGPIDVKNTKGSVEYKIGSGQVKIDAQVEKLNGKSGSGSTDVKGVLADVSITAGSGSIKITYPAVPSKGELNIKSGSGNAEVWMPAGAKIMTDVMQGSGKTYNELGDSKDAPYKISFKAGSGNLDIKKIQ
jgi:hypothetical protein